MIKTPSRSQFQRTPKHRNVQIPSCRCARGLHHLGVYFDGPLSVTPLYVGNTWILVSIPIQLRQQTIKPYFFGFGLQNLAIHH